EAGVAGVLLDQEERCGLLAATVPSCGLRRGQALDQPLGKREVAVALEGDRERVDGLLRDEDVPLCGIPCAGAAARPVVAFLTRERRRAARAVHDPDLPLCAALVGGGQRLDDLLCGAAFLQEGKSVRPVPGICVRLGRDRADVW